MALCGRKLLWPTCFSFYILIYLHSILFQEQYKLDFYPLNQLTAASTLWVKILKETGQEQNQPISSLPLYPFTMCQAKINSFSMCQQTSNSEHFSVVRKLHVFVRTKLASNCFVMKRFSILDDIQRWLIRIRRQTSTAKYTIHNSHGIQNL